MGGGRNKKRSASHSTEDPNSPNRMRRDEIATLFARFPQMFADLFKAQEEAKEKKVAGEKLKEALASCAMTHLGVTKLPEPLLLRKPQVLKEPATWLVYFEKRVITRPMIMDTEGNDGPVVLDFHNKLRALFGDLDAEDDQLRVFASSSSNLNLTMSYMRWTITKI